ncbi:MAG: DUF4416 family protein [Desulfatibacillaceae bacterium]|nr:DUF4416 family protein [Desulfatibacillaceae bacterium]
MSTLRPLNPVKLVAGFFLADKKLAAPFLTAAQKRFGPVDILSPWFVFDQTRYYEKETGWPLFRRLASFSQLVAPLALVEAKLWAQEIEQQFTGPDGARRLNVDPGYLAAERFVLATGKNFVHRIALTQGVYADLTLIYTNKGFQTLPWTYPDYAGGDIQDFLLQVRKKYFFDIKRGVSGAL